jgi:hypothetical protein
LEEVVVAEALQEEQEEGQIQEHRRWVVVAED